MLIYVCVCMSWCFLWCLFLSVFQFTTCAWIFENRGEVLIVVISFKSFRVHFFSFCFGSLFFPVCERIYVLFFSARRYSVTFCLISLYLLLLFLF